MRALAATAATLLTTRGVRRGASKDTPTPEDLFALTAALTATLASLRVTGSSLRAATQRELLRALTSCARLPLPPAAAIRGVPPPLLPFESLGALVAPCIGGVPKNTPLWGAFGSSSVCGSTSMTSTHAHDGDGSDAAATVAVASSFKVRRA